MPDMNTSHIAGNSESEFELHGAKSSGLLPAYPVTVTQEDEGGGAEVRECTGCKERMGSSTYHSVR